MFVSEILPDCAGSFPPRIFWAIILPSACELWSEVGSISHLNEWLKKEKKWSDVKNKLTGMYCFIK